MSVLTPIVETWDGANRLIYLKQGVSDYYPIEDLYHEMRYDRRINEESRKYELLLKAEGNIPKGAGAYTPRYIILLDGTKIVPYDEVLRINQLGDMITDDPDVDPSLYDVSTLTVPKVIFIKPSEAETIQLNSEAIVYSSFQGGVWVDVNSSYDTIGSAAEPNGNAERPVNNIALGLQIANTRGFNKIYLISNITLNSGNDMSGFYIEGRSHINTLVTIEDSAIVNDINIFNCHLNGIMDGGIDVTFCVIENLTYMSGHIHGSSLQGTLILGGTEDAFMVNCSQADNDIIPIISMGGSGQNLVMPNYAGYIKIKNLGSSGNKAYVGLNYGKVILDTATVSGGTIEVGGNGYLEDELGNTILTGTWNGNVTIINGLVNKDTVANSVWSEPLSGYDTGAGRIQQLQILDGFVRIDTVNGVAGTAFPIGTYKVPSNNLTDTLTICENNNIGRIRVRSDITVETIHDISNKCFESRGIMGTDLTFTDGCSADGSTFRYLNLQGILSGDCKLLVENCSIYNLANFTGIMQGVSFAQGSELSIGQWAEIYNCRAGGEPGNEPEISIGDSILSVQQYRGNLKLTGKTGDNRTVASFLPGNVTIDSTCVSGSIQILGIGEVEADNSGDNCHVDLDAVISRASISEAVWDEELIKHLNDKTTGHALMHESYDDTIFVDPINGTNGSTYPHGIRQHPVKNITDVLAVSNNYNLSKVHVLGSLNINGGENISGFTFSSDRSLGNIVTVSAGSITNETYFENLTVSGTMNGAVRYTTCVMGIINNFDGGAKNSLITGDINITGNGANYLTDCDTYVTDATYKQINVGNKLLNIIRCRGNYEIINYTGSSAVTIDLVAGHIKIADSCVSGIITVSGLVRLIDNSDAGCRVIDGTLSETGVVNEVWSKETSGYSENGTFGKSITEIKTNTNLIPGLV
jgi:hypothetical protein